MSLLNEVEKWFEGRRVALIKEYNPIKASGKFAEELQVNVKQQGSKIKGEITGARHTEQIIKGRRPNRKQDSDSLRSFVGWAGSTFLRQWVKDKGLSINPYAVAYKIAREGFQPVKPNLIDLSIKQSDLNNLKEVVRKNYGEVLRNEINEILK